MRMHKLSKAILLFVFVLTLTTVSVVALKTQDDTLTVGSYTVGLVEGNHLTEEEYEAILLYVLQYHTGTEQEETEPSPVNLLCIFGHDEVLQGAYAITHKVIVEDPRCKKTNYAVTTCTRCDYKDIVKTGWHYISCCPEE